ncbi:MAG: leucine-rich repeat domain-containing protein [Lachnospiraceae bacterium]|nr:leucine-rich repeat domain-containing protein [Lachnospiraceae bacterium]
MRAKKGNLLLVLVLAFCCSFAVRGEANADEGETETGLYRYNDFQYTYNSETGYICITGYLGSEKEVYVPDSIHGVPVKYILYLDAYNIATPKKKLTKVHLPDGLEYLGGLGGCVCLREIEIPDSVEVIANYAFENCRKLKTVKLPGNLKKIGAFAFDGCSSLEVTKLPNGVEEIGDCAFAGCKSIRSMKLPSTLEKLGAEAFLDCTNLKEINIPAGVTTIGESMFCGCEKLKKIKLPNHVTEIGEDAFADTAITEITIPATVKEIDGYAFLNCKRLRKVTLKGTKTKIRRNAFWGIHKKAVFYVPKSSVSKYTNRLIASKSFSGKKPKVKGRGN